MFYSRPCLPPVNVPHRRVSVHVEHCIVEIGSTIPEHAPVRPSPPDFVEVEGGVIGRFVPRITLSVLRGGIYARIFVR